MRGPPHDGSIWKASRGAQRGLDRILEHVASCAKCRERLARKRRPPEEEENSPLLRRSLGVVARRQAVLERERNEAPSLFGSLIALAPGQQLLLLRNSERFKTWGFFELLIERGKEETFSDPRPRGAAPPPGPPNRGRPVSGILWPGADRGSAGTNLGLYRQCAPVQEGARAFRRGFRGGLLASPPGDGRPLGASPPLRLAGQPAQGSEAHGRVAPAFPPRDLDLPSDGTDAGGRQSPRHFVDGPCPARRSDTVFPRPLPGSPPNRSNPRASLSAVRLE